MPTPDYVVALRQSYGHGLLFLPGVSAVVLDNAEPARILLVQRSDSGRWSLPAGIVEPGEQPADTIVREVLEETCVRVRAERLALLTVDDELSYPNGDRCQFVAMTFRCSYLGGEAQVGDEESTDVRWFALSELPHLREQELRRIRCGLRPLGDPTSFDSTY